MIPPGATLGMLGGGQLGRMFALAAAQMGYHVWVLDPGENSPAGEVAQHHIRAAYDDEDALTQLAEKCAVITLEFENVPAKAITFLSERCKVYPNAQAVGVAQNRIREKTFINDLGIPTSPFVSIESESDFAKASGLQWPCIIKTAQFGYDGKGQRVVESVEQARQAYADFEQQACVLEQKINLQTEISVVLARNEHEQVAFFPAAENEHRDGILHMSSVPAQVPEQLQTQAQQIAEKIAKALDYIGVLAVEYFIDAQKNLLVNEIAPRVHNSGHYSMDACHVSQFAQQVRVVCGWPPADTQNHHAVSMVNILGDAWQQGGLKYEALLGDPRVHLHLYGKDEPKPGRKMGHFNVVGEDPAEVRKLAADTYSQLMGLG